MAAWPIHLNIHTTFYQRTKSEQDNQQKYLKYIPQNIKYIFFSIFVIRVIIQTGCCLFILLSVEQKVLPFVVNQMCAK